MSSAIETYRGTVFPWECNANGHMPVWPELRAKAEALMPAAPTEKAA